MARKNRRTAGIDRRLAALSVRRHFGRGHLMCLSGWLRRPARSSFTALTTERATLRTMCCAISVNRQVFEISPGQVPSLRALPQMIRTREALATSLQTFLRRPQALARVQPLHRDLIAPVGEAAPGGARDRHSVAVCAGGALARCRGLFDGGPSACATGAFTGRRQGSTLRLAGSHGVAQRGRRRCGHDGRRLLRRCCTVRRGLRRGRPQGADNGRQGRCGAEDTG